MTNPAFPAAGRSKFFRLHGLAPTAEDVIIQKLRWSSRAKRSKDFADAVAVLQVQGNALDWPYIEHWCGLHHTLDLLAEAKVEAAPAWED